MKKLAKQLLCAAMLVMTFSLCGITTQAAKKVVPATVRIDVGLDHLSYVDVNLPKKDDKVKNLKFSSKNIVGNVTDNSYSDGQRYVNIRFYAKKEGTYTIRFDIYKANGKKRSHHTIKVKAIKGYYDVLNSVALDGKKTEIRVLGGAASGGFGHLAGSRVGSDGWYSYFADSTKKSVKVKLNPRQGIKIKKIKWIKTVYGENGGSDKETSGNFKNGSKVTLPAQGKGSMSFQITYKDSLGKTSQCGLHLSYKPKNVNSWRLQVEMDGRKMPVSGKSSWNTYVYTTKKKARIKFSMQGAKIAKIEMEKIVNGKARKVTVRNGSKVSFNKELLKADDALKDPLLRYTDFTIYFKKGKGDDSAPICHLSVISLK